MKRIKSIEILIKKFRKIKQSIIMENSIKFCLEDILKKKQELDYSSQQTIQSIYDIASESRRVADYAQQHQELKNLDV